MIDDLKRTGEASKSMQLAGLLAFIWVSSDAMLTYFGKTLLGAVLPVNAVLPILLLIFVWQWGLRAVLPSRGVLVALFLGLFGFFVGFVAQGTIEVNRVGAPALAMCAFLVGYFCFRWTADADVLAKGLLFVAGTYAFVCVIALIKLAPTLFPIINTVWSNKGQLELRPEVMTDQNFQIFYLLPGALILALPVRPLRFIVAIACSLAALYVLAKLQTRSGFLVLVATVVLAWLAPIWTPSLGREKLLVLPVILGVLVVSSIEVFLQVGEQLMARFFDKGAGTGYGRLLSTYYMFQHIMDPSWWLPRGNDDFVTTYGDLPHSNLTAMFLEGGILGVGMWITVFVWPLFSLGRLFLAGRLDAAGTIVLLGGVGFIVVQMSLNVPFFKQPWLWAGAVAGTWNRLRAGREAKRKITVMNPGVLPVVSASGAARGRMQ